VSHGEDDLHSPEHSWNCQWFQTTGNARNEIRESNEGDNASREEIFTIGAPPPPAFCNTLQDIRNQIATLQRQRDDHAAQERYWRDRENHYRHKERENKDCAKHYDRKYHKYKRKYKKKHKSKYKRKYKKYKRERNKYRARAKRNKEKYQEADREKRRHEAAKHDLQRRINQMTTDLRNKEAQCR